MHSNRIERIEQHARDIMAKIAPDMAIAHDWKHIDRVRRWALRIAQQEGFDNLEMVEAAALLHDIGLASVTERSRACAGWRRASSAVVARGAII